MPDLWYRLLYRLADAIYFARVTVIYRERLPEDGPVLFLGLHRNGAVDGFIYKRVLGNVVFLASRQLLKNFFLRIFFTGIPVTRTKDEGDRSANREALRACVEHLKNGGRLFVFPEGTSSLGPRHLPFKSGAAWLIADYLASAGHTPPSNDRTLSPTAPSAPLRVVPVGIHYECAWAFRSKVEVVIGEPINTALPGDATDIERLKELRRRITAGLEKVGVNVTSAEYQEDIQRLAYVSTLATPRSYFESLKALETHVPGPIATVAQTLHTTLNDPAFTALRRHQGVPLFPMGSRWLYVVLLLLLAPLVLAAILLNALPFVAAWYAGKRFPDGPNVIALWRILVGLPLFVFWSLAVVIVSVLAGYYGLALGYTLVTWLGLQLYCRVKKLAVAVHNGFRFPGLRPQMLAVRETVLRSLPDAAPTTVSTPDHEAPIPC